MVLESDNTEHFGYSKMKHLKCLEHLKPLNLCIGFYLVLTPGCDFFPFFPNNFCLKFLSVIKLELVLILTSIPAIYSSEEQVYAGFVLLKIGNRCLSYAHVIS